MTCDEFAIAASEPRAPTRAMREHAAACAGCAALARLDEALREPGEEPAMSQALRQAVAAPRPLRRPYSAARRGLLPAAALVALLWAWGRIAVRPDLDALPGWAGAAVSLGLLALFAAGLAVVLARGRAGLGASARTRASYLALAICAYAGLGLLWAFTLRGPQPVREAQRWLGAHVVPLAGEWARHLPCLGLGAGAAALLLVAILLAAARTSAAAPALSGAVAGASAAMGAGLVLLVFCSSRSAAHIVGVHGLAFAAALALGAAVGRRAFAP